MINLEAFISSMKITWLRRLILYKNQWQSMTHLYFDENKLFNCGAHYAEKMANNCSNKFWKNVLSDMANFKALIKIDSSNYLKEPLFYNHNILIGNKSVF